MDTTYTTTHPKTKHVYKMRCLQKELLVLLEIYAAEASEYNI